MLLKNGITDKYANNKVIIIEYSIAFNVSARLTSKLSSNSLVESNCINAVATLPGLGIKPFDVVCHKRSVVNTCITIIMISVCLLIFPNGLKILPPSLKGEFEKV